MTAPKIAPKSASGPLADLVVIEMGTLIAGPFAGQILGDFGAEVIKIEDPKVGDPMRQWGRSLPKGLSPWWPVIGRNKKSVGLDLRQPEGQAIARQLIAQADVVIENFRPGTMEKLGYGWETLHAKYPHLIYGAASGFGDTGPYSRRAAYDMVVQGMGGIMSMTGQPNNPPTRVGVSIGDIVAGLYLTIGVIAAIQKRTQGGGAVKVDIAMLDCQVAMLEDALAAYTSLGEVAHPLGSRHPEIAPFQAYQTSDSYLVIAAGNDHLFTLMAKALSRPDLIQNPNYTTNALRHTHVDALEQDLAKTLCARPTKDWLEILNAAGVPCGPVNTVADVAKDPQVAARNMIIAIQDPVIGRMRVPGNPIKLSGVPERLEHRPSPAVDADRAAILALIKAEQPGKTSGQ